MIPDPQKVETDDNFNLIVEFTNGQVRSVNIKDFLLSSNEIKTNLKLFKTAFIEDGAAITWSNGISIDPEIIYMEGRKNRPKAKATPSDTLVDLIQGLIVMIGLVILLIGTLLLFFSKE
jgi:hypothetical protein